MPATSPDRLPRRGFGASGPVAHSWHEHAEDAADLLQALHTHPAAVVVHSGGCIVALELALRHPDLVTQLILLDPAVYLTKNLTPRFLLTYLAARALGTLRLRRLAARQWLRYANGYSTGGNAFDKLPVALQHELLEGADGIFADFAIGDGSHPDPGALHLLRMPVTVVTGELSQPFLGKSANHLIARLPAPARRTLEKSGHAMAFDQPDALVRLLTELLNARPAPPS